MFDLASADSPIGVLVRKVVIAGGKPHEALTKLLSKSEEIT